jgi:hypothetical protein
VNYLVLKEIAYRATDVPSTETERTQIANPSAYGRFVTSDLPTHLAFLTLFTIGQSQIIAENYPIAINIIEYAVDLPSSVSYVQPTAESSSKSKSKLS